MRNKSKQRWRRECRPLPSHQTHKPRGGSAPHPNCEGSGPALQSFLKGWAEGDIMLPFHRNLELLQEVSNVTETRLSFLTAAPWDINRCLYSILWSTKFIQSPSCTPGQDRLGTLVSLSICNRKANVMSHLCCLLLKCQDCPFD